ncbi:MAG TPA: TonB C-terminal domain-containing protein [Gemmatimonadaceae bacterium]|nr:TonB C-terminal domain-containing protein [Gemmatimonadaceae bacterium]
MKAAGGATQPESLVPNARPMLALPLTGSLVLHAALIALFFILRPTAPPPSAPVYRVDLLAAPPGERGVGVVKPPTPEPPAAAPPVRPKPTPHDMPAPTSKPPKKSVTSEATPTLPTEAKPDTKPPTTAGGGETGGRGTDVVTVSTGGTEFPYSGYLENIVRQIAIRFKPSSRGALHAEVFFIINRDGSVSPSSIRLVTRSGNYSFDADAQGAVESAANLRAFGALPVGYTEESLPVTFKFDPRLLR